MSYRDGKNHQLPSNIVAEEFGEVNVCYRGDVVEVNFTVLMEPTGKDAEGWRTGVALDASASMKGVYGKKLEGMIPPQVKKQYKKRGWLNTRKIDGTNVERLSRQAMQDAIQQGYLQYGKNEVEELSRNFVSYLASSLDAEGKTHLVYWACGNGSDYEVLGDFGPEECKRLKIDGPKTVKFGTGTNLMPVLRYFENHFAKAQQSMAIFITDGKLEDFDRVKNFTIQLAQKIEKEERHFMKCVLIGIGEEISREQMEELDDLETGTDVDIWDHKVAKEMRSLIEIFAEVVNEHQIIAPVADIYDDQGNLVKKFSDGMPALVTFEMPASSSSFTLAIGENQLQQKICLDS